MTLSSMLLLRMQRETSEQIDKKGNTVNISFYYFYDNSNKHNIEIMQVATWWIQKHNLPHFVRATVILELIESELKNL